MPAAGEAQRELPIELSGTDGTLRLGGTDSADEFQLKGVNWFGAEGALDRVPYGLDVHSIGWYARLLRRHGFNAVRLFFVHAAVLANRPIPAVSAAREAQLVAEPAMRGLLYVDMLGYVAAQLHAHGLVVVLAAHRLTPSAYPGGPKSGLWYNDDVPIGEVRRSWLHLAARLCAAGRGANIVGVDLQNEPFASGWGSADAAVDWRRGAEQLGAHIHGLCPRWLVLVEGVGQTPGAMGARRGDNDYMFWGENLIGAGRYPVNLPDQSKLVYSPHLYGPDFSHGTMPYFHTAWPDFDDGLPWIWEKHFGYLTGARTDAMLAVGSPHTIRVWACAAMPSHACAAMPSFRAPRVLPWRSCGGCRVHPSV